MTDKPNELETLIPDDTLEIAGVSVTVHEYTFMEGLRVDAIAAPVVDGLAGIFLDREGDGQFPMSELAAVFGDHPETLVELLSIATGMPQSWVKALGDADGQLLLMTWWAQNRFFFVRRLVQEMAGRQAAEKASGSLAGASVLPA